ncbi:MFS transporter [Primorskyibacter flagellatus]|uniref:MFS transporter n=1 Tax=Primorskyibacter flagellatus TaxID=1387277 RepID=A0A917A565_9RHOB|nr:tripartite tricarboxylate transporter substrate binding protein [Primorskyibacter flagellatus]GGE27710.1 MFS transporter [Primorskyibacter flagellatus]
MKRLALLFASAIALSATAARADYPEKPITMIVGYAAGGTSDTAARVTADALSKQLGQPVVVENKPGAATTIASNYVREQPADGYTLYAAAVSLALNGYLQPSVAYEMSDFDYLSGMADVPFVLHVNNDLGVSNMAGLIQAIKDRPGELAIGTSGAGAINHLIAEYWKDALGLDAIIIHYQGDAPARQDLMAGNIQMSFTAVTAAAPLIEAGKTTGIAVTSADRLEELPDLPTVAEAAGLDGFSATYWMALAAPAGLPEDVKARLGEAVDAMAADDALTAEMKKLGMVKTMVPAADIKARFEKEQGVYGKLIEEVGITTQ